MLACLLAPYIFMGIRRFPILLCQAPIDLFLGKDPSRPASSQGPSTSHLLSPRPLFPTELLILSFLLRFPLNGGSPTEILRALVAITKLMCVINAGPASVLAVGSYSCQPVLCPQVFSLLAFLWGPGDCGSGTPTKTYQRLLFCSS